MQTDIHTETAKKMFGTNNITPEMRLAAKRKNFLDIYGKHNASMEEAFERWENGTSPEEMMKQMKEFYKMDEFEDRAMTMYERACEIRDLCDSEYASDSHLTEMSEKFKADFGCNWTEILN